MSSCSSICEYNLYDFILEMLIEILHVIDGLDESKMGRPPLVVAGKTSKMHIQVLVVAGRTSAFQVLEPPWIPPSRNRAHG